MLQGKNYLLPGAQPLKTKCITAFLWFVSLYLFGPTKLLLSEILDRDPAHHHEVLPEGWKQMKSYQITTKPQTKSGFLDALPAF